MQTFIFLLFFILALPILLIKLIFTICTGNESFKYTMRHWYWFQKVAFKYRLWRPRHLVHDMDKQLVRLLYPNLDARILQNIHREGNSHHIKKGENPGYINKKRGIDMFIDWECARFTKPDKPLNALETLEKFYPEYSKVLKPLFVEILDVK